MILGVAGFAAYLNSVSAPLLLDDSLNIARNSSLQQLWPPWRALWPPPDTGFGGRPIANFAFALNHAISGDSLRGYHLGNLLIHILASVTLFGVVRRTAMNLGVFHQARTLAVSVSVLWLLHPLQTQSVTYLSQRTESLMGCFYLATVYFFVRATESPRVGWQALAVLCCLLGMATKEGMVTAPIMLFLYDCTFVAGGSRRAWQARRWLYCGLLATWVMLALLMLTLPQRGVGFDSGVSALSYATIECGAVLRYLQLVVWPAGLVFDYGFELGPMDTSRILAVVVVGTGIALVVLGLKRRALAGFLGAWFLITLAPTSSLVPIALQPIAENRPYLASIAVITGATVAVTRVARYATSALFISLALALGILTAARNADYRSAVAIWSDTVLKRPRSARAHHNLGEALAQAGRTAEAQIHFQNALSLAPNYADAHANLGNAFLQLNQLESAVAELEIATRLAPRHAIAHINLATAYGRLKQHDRAVAESQLARQLDPSSALAAYNLGIALAQLGQARDAVPPLLDALRLKPSFTEAYLWLAIVHLRMSQPALAARHAEAALRANPNLLDARYYLAVAYLNLDRRAEAINMLAALLALRPDHIEANFALGTARLQIGQPGEAIACFEAVLRLDPTHADSHANLGVALWRTGRVNEASRHFEAALKSNPNQAVAQEHLAKLRAEQGVR